MTNQEFIKQFKEILDNMFEIMNKKNHDYWWGTEPFNNFKMTELLWITSVENWILTRMTDKLSRIIQLKDKDWLVDEKITDTLEDLANYSIILLLYFKSKWK